MDVADLPIMEAIDYTEYLEEILLHLDKLTYATGVLMNVTLFSMGVAVAIGVCYFLYKAIKQLF